MRGGRKRRLPARYGLSDERADGADVRADDQRPDRRADDRRPDSADLAADPRADVPAMRGFAKSRTGCQLPYPRRIRARLIARKIFIVGGVSGNEAAAGRYW